jgi:hypothetical protein
MTIATLQDHAPYEARIHCGGAMHRLRWEAGTLQALDHVDAEGERALVALGGDPCSCIDALDSWAAHADDLRVLALTSRGPADRLQFVQHPGSVASGPMAMVHRLSLGQPPPAPPGRMLLVGRNISGYATGNRIVSVAAGHIGPNPFPQTDDLVGLLSLDGGLTARLVLTVAGTWVERLAAGDGRGARARPALIAALYGRVTSAVRLWMSSPDLVVDVEMLAPGEAPMATRAEDGIRIAVPFSWLVDVWGRNLAVTFERFVLGVTTIASDRYELIAVDGALTGPRRMRVTLG